MAQPILFNFNPGIADSFRDPYDFFENGLTRKRQQRVRRFQLGDGYEQVTPDGVNNLINAYDFRTRPLTYAEASSLDEDFQELNGDFFFARFPQDDVLYRYRLEPNKWTWEIISNRVQGETIGDGSPATPASLGARLNVISFSVKQIYDWRS